VGLVDKQHDWLLALVDELAQRAFARFALGRDLGLFVRGEIIESAVISLTRLLRSLSTASDFDTVTRFSATRMSRSWRSSKILPEPTSPVKAISRPAWMAPCRPCSTCR
jgi:hypothetical protein